MKPYFTILTVIVSIALLQQHCRAYDAKTAEVKCEHDGACETVITVKHLHRHEQAGEETAGEGITETAEDILHKAKDIAYDLKERLAEKRFEIPSIGRERGWPKAKEESKEAVRHMGRAAEGVKEGIEDAFGKPRQEFKEGVKEKLGEWKEGAKEKLGEWKEGTKEKLGEWKEGTKEKLGEWKEGAKEKAYEAKGTVQGMKERAKETLLDVGERVRDAKEGAESWAKGAKESLKDTARETLGKARAYFDRTGLRSEELKETVAETAGRAAEWLAGTAEGLRGKPTGPERVRDIMREHGLMPDQLYEPHLHRHEYRPFEGGGRPVEESELRPKRTLEETEMPAAASRKGLTEGIKELVRDKWAGLKERLAPHREGMGEEEEGRYREGLVGDSGYYEVVSEGGRERWEAATMRRRMIERAELAERQALSTMQLAVQRAEDARLRAIECVKDYREAAEEAEEARREVARRHSEAKDLRGEEGIAEKAGSWWHSLVHWLGFGHHPDQRYIHLPLVVH